MPATSGFELGASTARDYWEKLRIAIQNRQNREPKLAARKCHNEVAVAELPLIREVSLTLFDRYAMPAWTVDHEGKYLDSLNAGALSMTTRFAETMQTERPPQFTDVERAALVSRVLAMSAFASQYPVLFMTEQANWLVFPLKHDRACCAIVLLR